MRCSVNLLCILILVFATVDSLCAQSLKFNGSSQFGQIGHNAALQLKSFTIEMWVRPEGTGTVSANGSGSGGVTNAVPLVSKGRGESESPLVDVNYYAGIHATSNKIGFDFEDDNTAANHPIYSATPLVNCIWQHVAATYNDTTGVWKVYINGIEDSTKTLSQSFHPQSASTVNLSFATGINSANVSDGFFNGSMDELRIWKRVRTNAEIFSGKNIEIINDVDLVARYSMNESSGSTASNSSSTGAGLNATLFNTPAWNNASFDINSMLSGAIDMDGVNGHIALGSASSLRATSFTLEGWIRIEGASAYTSTGTGGIAEAIPIITKGRGESETPGLNMNYFFGLDANNVLVADFEEASGPNHPVSGVTPLQSNVWYHVAVTYGSDGVGGNEWKLYINGILDKQKKESASAIPEPNSAQHSAIGTAMTSTGAAQGFFNGKMDEIRIWNTVRTEADIIANYLSPLGSGAGLIARWGLNECAGNTASNSAGIAQGTISNGAIRTATDYNPAPYSPSNPIPVNGATQYSDNKVSIYVSDRNNQSMTVKLFGRKKTVGGNSKFVVIGLPDTQYYTSHMNGGTNELFKAQTQWIADHRLDSNIVYVSQLGDCVEHGDNGGNDIEWKRADTAMRKIESPGVPIAHGIPYSICVGNHDQGTIYNPNSPTNFYNQYFGEARFAGRSYYGGHYGNNNDNSFTFFSAGGVNFLHIALEYNDNNNSNQGSNTDVETLQLVLNWADSLLKAHPGRKAILATHNLIGTGNTASWQGGGQKIYDELKDNPNLFLMLCGHVSGQGRRVDVFNGNTIHTLLSDFQGYTNGGNGYLRVMQFDPANNTLSVRTHSPTAGALPNATEIANGNYNLTVNLAAAYSSLNTQNNATGMVDLTWVGLEPNAQYEWYATASDGESELTSSIFSFTTSGIVPLRMLEFRGAMENKRIRLKWKTSTEVNTNKFIVEKSVDGRTFSWIGEVPASRNSGIVNDYVHYDPYPAKGINHYRLKIIDNDGVFIYSSVLHVANNDELKSFEIYPNPSNGQEFSIFFTANNPGNVLIRVYDLNGRLQQNREQSTSNNMLVLKHSLPQGIYIVSVTTNNKEEIRRLVVH